MHRRVESEILDSLSPDDAAIPGIRRDLRLINEALRAPEWFARELPRRLLAGERVLEIGAGDGDLGRRLRAQGAPVDGLDRMPRPASWPASAVWICEDLRSYRGYSEYACVIGSMIFHQLTDGELAELGRHLSGARLILASEPTRRRLSQWICAATGPVAGAHAVTRHDARVSIAAGFRGDELPRALGLAAPAWRWTCRSTWLGAYRMVAWRSP